MDTADDVEKQRRASVDASFPKLLIEVPVRSRNHRPALLYSSVHIRIAPNLAALQHCQTVVQIVEPASSVAL